MALALAHSHNLVFAQFSDPRTYTNSPVDLNQIELMYAYVRSDASIDPSIIVGNAKFNLNQGVIAYTRYFGVRHRLTWIQPSIPIASASGSIAGTTISGDVNGAGDTSYQIGTLLKGGPALTASEFETYKPKTSIGASFTFTAPTGQYDHNRLLNLGSDRWSFKPEVGLSHPFGPEQKWVIDAYVNSYFFSDNTMYRGAEVLKQMPLPGVEAHLSYSLNNSVWASLDIRYSFRGDTLINGVNQDNVQRNFIVGSQLNASINARSTLIFVYAHALVHDNGPNISGFAVRYDYVWGKGLR
ncbi:transporter [Terriglobus sp. TAA 43]|uniref:transporter n=1 Tax=Terriglobus sp. TAA 43 TaxID=278961 RepID=UPI00068F85B5|nr:transporter [Terriglobus sp. TAA 43]